MAAVKDVVYCPEIHNHQISNSLQLFKFTFLLYLLMISHKMDDTLKFKSKNVLCTSLDFFKVADRIDSFEIGPFHRRNSLNGACEEGGWPRRGWQRLVHIYLLVKRVQLATALTKQVLYLS